MLDVRPPALADRTQVEAVPSLDEFNFSLA